MFDVIYLDGAKTRVPVASGLARDAAISAACTEAGKRRCGRMFAAGSQPHGDVVLIVPADATDRPLPAAPPVAA